MATKRPAPNKENCPPSRPFDFDLDDDDFDTMFKPFQPKNTQQSISCGLKTQAVKVSAAYSWAGTAWTLSQKGHLRQG